MDKIWIVIVFVLYAVSIVLLAQEASKQNEEIYSLAQEAYEQQE